MTTITKERIELFIKNPLENGLARGEQMELAQIALASLAAEPVAWKATFTQIDHEYNTFTAMYSDKAEVERWVRLHKVGDFRAKITPLYASSPALVVPDKLPREYIRGWPLAYSDYAEGWNDCREAMLQSGNFRENKDSSTNNFREISETSTNSPLIPGEVLSAIREVARIRADFDDFDGDRRGVGDCLDEAEQELIVTINKYASQLAVEPVVPAVLERLRTIVADPRALPRRKEWVSGQQYSYVLLENVEAMVDEACHAAMLQGSQPVSQTYNLPELIEGMEVSIDVSTCDADLGNRYFGTVTEALELDTAKNGYILLVQDAEPNFDVNGNSPGTPDSWISCSDRMPEKGQNVLISVNFDSSLVEPLICSARYTGSTFRRGDATIKPGNGIEQATHWMPLPEPPQEVK
ncbi:TPA: DUF551 domain-containing protein [Escherichia coli]|nr:DUF551 domain-containing protein [Escherichia coli]EEQ4273284.1 DUF551 domain-containing protein [Escherichia coli]EEQ4304223.1 DUF551 domain-containing protein [Escherichia coli]EET0106735.1 DUF551 domain-containing protein [Escherichia coli]EEV9054912.1 DUF551 domain-containing protein [Escherichia coli]